MVENVIQIKSGIMINVYVGGKNKKHIKLVIDVFVKMVNT